jgi:Dynein heavy chain, N-terminal region 2
MVHCKRILPPPAAWLGCFQAWLLVQRKWMYLEGIFSSNDIRNQLPAEAKRFDSIDRAWHKIMSDTAKNPTVLEACSIDGRCADRYTMRILQAISVHGTSTCSRWSCVRRPPSALPSCQRLAAAPRGGTPACYQHPSPPPSPQHTRADTHKGCSCTPTAINHKHMCTDWTSCVHLLSSWSCARRAYPSTLMPSDAPFLDSSSSVMKSSLQSLAAVIPRVFKSTC